MTLIPWVNGNFCGFFEYVLKYKELFIVARDLKTLQDILTLDVKNTNIDKINKEAYRLFYDEETKYYEYRDFDEYFKENIDEIENTLMKNSVLIPWDITIEETGYETVNYSKEDVYKLEDIVKTCPNVNQHQLVEIFSGNEELNTVEREYFDHLKDLATSEVALDSYENSIEVSEMLCEMYEANKEMEEQLISNSEMIVDLYETINKKEEES